jgi:hypothetical protein
MPCGIGEQIDVSANGSRVRIARNVASVSMDVDVDLGADES